MNSAAIILLLSACGTSNSPQTRTVQTSEYGESRIEEREEELLKTPSAARLVELTDVSSQFVQSRNVTIWLPPGYGTDPDRRYPVIYAHDGQNVFHAGHSYAGVEWRMDETAERLMSDGTIRPAIVVGIWNTDLRWQEYAPQKVLDRIPQQTTSEWLDPEIPEIKSDAYLSFVVKELKPYIDATYLTASEAANTLIMGSSMGGLISLYALAEYPNTFSRAAAVSIHWPLTEPEGAIAQRADSAMQAYLAESGLDATQHTLWFDHGTEALDAAYPPHAQAMEAWFRDQGWTSDQAQFRAYPGTDHSEGAWADRLDEILIFLLEE